MALPSFPETASRVAPVWLLVPTPWRRRPSHRTGRDDHHDRRGIRRLCRRSVAANSNASVKLANLPNRQLPISFGAHHVVFEVARRVGLGPHADLAHDGRTEHGVIGRSNQDSAARCCVGAGHGAERVLEGELAVEMHLDVGAVHGQLEVVPRRAIGMNFFARSLKRMLRRMPLWNSQNATLFSVSLADGASRHSA